MTPINPRHALVACCLLAAPLIASDTLPSHYPVWWYNTQAPSLSIATPASALAMHDNYSVINVGQLKWVASRAKAYLDEHLQPVGGSKIDLSKLFPPMPASTSPDYAEAIKQNYQPANIGQLKAVAQVFYDRLNQTGYDTWGYLRSRGFPESWQYAQPWAPPTSETINANYALANLGQLKLAFGFDLTGVVPRELDSTWVDSNKNGINDAWETSHGSGSNPAGSDAYYQYRGLSSDAIQALKNFQVTIISPQDGAVL
jgi:hypothetical protein